VEKKPTPTLPTLASLITSIPGKNNSGRKKQNLTHKKILWGERESLYGPLETDEKNARRGVGGDECNKLCLLKQQTMQASLYYTSEKES